MITDLQDFPTIVTRIWRFLAELPVAVAPTSRNVHNRSIVRAIGTILPLPPPPRVCINLDSWNSDYEGVTNNSGCKHISPEFHKRSDCQHQINQLQDELKVIKDKLTLLFVEHEVSRKLEKPTNKPSSITEVSEVKQADDMNIPLPPPPPPMPDFNLISSRPPRLVKSKKCLSRYGPQPNNDALDMVLSQLTKEKPKLRHVERSPGGRPIRPKRIPEIDPNDVLAQVLKRRYSAVQESSDSESFNTSFSDITSPLKSSVC